MTHTGPPPAHIATPVMKHEWTSLTFLHWRYDVETVQRLLPPRLTVEPYDGSAWVGLVPFHMLVRPPVGPPVPWLSRFPETNVRTYVSDPTGRLGIWFFSLDAARLAAVIAARTSYQLPYFWGDMAVVRDGDLVRYSAQRRWPGPRARSYTEIEAGEPIPAGEVGEFEHYLTARFELFTRIAGRLFWAQAEHRPWQLRRASVLALDDGFVAAAGLPAPRDEPLVHFSDGVEVRIGGPHLAA